MKTIAIFGAFGVPNVGDDAILQANLEWIESRYGSNCRVYIFTKDATYTSLYIKTRLNIVPVTYIHDVTKSQWYDSDKIENELEQIKIGNKESLVKGDQRSLSIAAASIVAKVYRDELMVQYSQTYPEFGFERNMGYGTKEHLEALDRVGYTPIHRRSFEPVKSMYKTYEL